MKKEKNLRVFLYVVLVLSLIYSCFVIFQAYGTWSAYYQGIAYSAIDLLTYIISTSYIPICFTVVFYVMIVALDIWCNAIERVFPQPKEIENGKTNPRKEEEAMNQEEKDVREVAREGLKAAREEAREERKEAREEARELRKEARELHKEEKEAIREQRREALKEAREEKEAIDKMEDAERKATNEAGLDKEDKKDLHEVEHDQRVDAFKEEHLSAREIRELAREEFKEAREEDKALREVAREGVKDVNAATREEVKEVKEAGKQAVEAAKDAQ